MKKVFIETTVFIRYFTQDDKKKYQDCRLLMQAVEEGKLIPYTSNIVILEIIFVLTKVYEFPIDQVIEAVKEILKMRNLTLIEKTDTRQALNCLKDLRIKFSDCLIASQIPKKTILLTYDADFKKISFLSPATPEKILSKPRTEAIRGETNN